MKCEILFSGKNKITFVFNLSDETFTKSAKH